MAPKRQCTRVASTETVKPGSGTNVRKRKKESSQEQTSGKRQRRNAPEVKAMPQLKEKNIHPLQEEVLQYIKRCINAAALSTLSTKKTTVYEPLHNHICNFGERLLQLCMEMRLPSLQIDTLRNLGRDLRQEKKRMKEYEDMLELLNHGLEEAVGTAEKLEESTVTLERKVETLKQEAQTTSCSLDQILSKKDPLQLPEETFEAPTVQDQAKKVDNPEFVLKELSLLQSNPIYNNMQNLLQASYAEISTL